jgi:hypothetical protein
MSASTVLRYWKFSQTSISKILVKSLRFDMGRIQPFMLAPLLGD